MLVAVGVVASLAISIALLPVVPGVTTTGPGPTSASTSSADGLRLTLRISGTQISTGGSITINVTETNTLATALNISAGKNWPATGLRMSPCYTSVYPFGVAVYQGHYTKVNISTAKPLNIYPLLLCPLLFRYISGYYFAPNSDSAMVLPGSTPSIHMTSGVAASGNYTGSTKNGFNPGEYTVAAGDEWGALVLLYFAVP